MRYHFPPSKKRQTHSPAAAKGNAISVNSNCPARNQSVTPVPTSRSCKNRKNSSDTKFRRVCQIKFGSRINTATPVPIHSHLLFQCRRTSVNTTPATTPTAKNAIVYFAIIPPPIPAPIPTHHRASPPPNNRTTQYATHTQHT